MKKSLFKRIIASVLTMAMMVSMSGVVFASGELGYQKQDASIQPRNHCNVCNEFMALKCNKAKVFSEKYSHTYDFGTKSCNVYVYKSSYLGYECPQCRTIYPMGISPTNSHECVAIHMICGAERDETGCRDETVWPDV